MRIKHLAIINKKITAGELKELAFIMFFCNPLIIRIFAFICSHIGISGISRMIALMIIYLPVMILCVTAPKSIPKDFFLLCVFLVLFITVTYLIHPEYEFWYTRNYYGVWDYVLRPDNGIYAYFFIRLLNSPDKIMKAMKKCAWIMYPYYAYLLASALKRGYWVNTGSTGQTIHLSYDLSYGYDVLIFTLVFLYAALKEKKPADIGMVAVGLAMILMGGSRGPLLCVAVFIALYFFMNFVESKNRLGIGLFLSGIVAGIAALYRYILGAVIYLMDRFGISSRTMTMLLQGNVMDDNGREKIWNAAIQMIKEHPFGYGALGTRHVIYYYHDVGHCHQLFLEILVDFGVIFGAALIACLLFYSVRIFVKRGNMKWKAVFLIFFARAFQLMLSGTYWHVASFWGCIGIGVAMYLGDGRKYRRKKYG